MLYISELNRTLQAESIRKNKGKSGLMETYKDATLWYREILLAYVERCRHGSQEPDIRKVWGKRCSRFGIIMRQFLNKKRPVYLRKSFIRTSLGSDIKVDYSFPSFFSVGNEVLQRKDSLNFIFGNLLLL